MTWRLASGLGFFFNALFCVLKNWRAELTGTHDWTPSTPWPYARLHLKQSQSHHPLLPLPLGGNFTVPLVPPPHTSKCLEWLTPKCQPVPLLSALDIFLAGQLHMRPIPRAPIQKYSLKHRAMYAAGIINVSRILTKSGHGLPSFLYLILRRE